MADPQTAVVATAAAETAASATPAQAPAGDAVIARATLRLPRTRKQALMLVRNHLKIGNAIREQRIRDMHDLDVARSEKQEWVTRGADLMKELFDEPAVAEHVNDWVGPILPEYAEFGNFVELFSNEMKHRLLRLNGVLKMINELPEPAPELSTGAATTAAAASTAPAETRFTRAAAASAVATRIAPRAAAPASAAASAAPSTPSSVAAGILIVRDAGSSQSVDALTEFLDKLGLNTVVIDTADASASPVAQQIEHHDSAAYALILPNAATEGDGQMLFDLGCCVGRFGASRVCVMGQQEPSPVVNSIARGVQHIRVDSGEGWQLQLARQLRSGGVAIDLNRLL